jgi:hypothetical protein
MEADAGRPSEVPNVNPARAPFAEVAARPRDAPAVHSNPSLTPGIADPNLGALKTRKVELCSHLSAHRRLAGGVTAAGSSHAGAILEGRGHVVSARTALADRAFFVVIVVPRARCDGDGCTAALEEVK